MLANATVRVTMPAVDIKRARKFYEGKLGLKVIKTDESPGIEFQAGGGTSLYLYQRGATKADHTVASFLVKDVAAEVKALKAKGIVFEDYDLPAMGIKTVNGIAKMGEYTAAWFKDSEGNILAIDNM